MFKQLLLLAVPAFFVLSSCSNDFELTADWEDIPVVYGLLNLSDTAQYIRIEKAFLDKTTSALVLAQVADSIYYQQLVAELIEKDQFGNPVTQYPLTRVDGNNEGYPRETGVFANSPNYLYKTTTTLDPDRIYELRMQNNENGKVVTAETGVIGPFSMVAPTSGASMRFDYNGTRSFIWDPPANAMVFDLTVELNYLEAPISDPTNKTAKSATWVLTRGFQSDDRITFKALGIEFYRTLANQIEEGPFIREFVDMDVILDAGGEHLANYLSVGKANAGITGAQDDIPSYSNLSEGRGIFSTRYRLINPGLVLNVTSRDSLLEGQYTRHLNFE